MTGSAGGTELSLMDVDVLVTIATPRFCIAHGRPGRMAIIAGGTDMRALQRKVRHFMIEEPGVQFDDIGVPALVLRVTGSAVTAPRCLEEPVKAGAVRAVTADSFVAGHTQQGSRLLRGCIVAGSAIAFELRVSGDDPSRHHELFDVSRQSLAGSGVCHEHSDGHRDETRCCSSTMCRPCCHRE